jgi:hypothetical protein
MRATSGGVNVSRGWRAGVGASSRLLDGAPAAGSLAAAIASSRCARRRHSPPLFALTGVGGYQTRRAKARADDSAVSLR